MAQYATAAELQIRTNMLSAPSPAQLIMLNQMLEAASRCIDRMCRKRVDFFTGVVVEARFFAGTGEAWLRIPVCTAITEVAVKEGVAEDTYTAWTSPTTPMADDGDWIPCHGDPVAPVFSAPYTLIIIDPGGEFSEILDGDGDPTVRVTGSWGEITATPDDIREACVMQAARWLKQMQGAMASELGAANFGQIMYRRNLDNNIKQILVDGGWITPLYGDTNA